MKPIVIIEDKAEVTAVAEILPSYAGKLLNDEIEWNKDAHKAYPILFGNRLIIAGINNANPIVSTTNEIRIICLTNLMT